MEWRGIEWRGAEWGEVEWSVVGRGQNVHKHMQMNFKYPRVQFGENQSASPQGGVGPKLHEISGVGISNLKLEFFMNRGSVG